MPPDADVAGIDEDGAWADRQRRWARKLGRLRLGVEPLEVQLARRRRVAWALTAVPALIALMYLGLFAAFHRPRLGLLIAGALLGPVVAFAWLDFATLSRRARAYERERRAHEARGGRVGSGASRTP